MNQPESQDRIVVQPILRSPAGAQTRAPVPTGPDRRSRVFVAVGLVALIVAAAVVFFYLPRLVPQQPQPQPAAQAPPPAAVPVPKPKAAPEEVDYLKLAEAMDKAEQARGAYEAWFSSYDKRGAAQWAGDAFSAAQTKGAEALRQFEAREFAAAEATYQDGLQDLHRVGEIVNTLLKQQLEEGSEALVQGRSAAARQAFEFALRLDPDNELAARGLKRAGTIDAAYASLTAAGDAERAGKLTEAAKLYGDTLKIDPELRAASEGLQRVQATISADQFALAMSQAMSALSTERPKEARAALERAARIRPAAPEIKSGLARAAELERHQTVLNHRRQAEELENSELWDKALAEYQAALQLDPALEFAKAGTERVRPRAEMNKQFTELIGRPDRLFAPAVRQQARELLAVAEKITSPGPVLQEQTAKLAGLIAQAETPVSVALNSDNQTRVVINRVAQLGTFSQRRLDLLPGRYVVIGTREGYRDVRRELTVRPGESPTLTVQCEERI